MADGTGEAAGRSDAGSGVWRYARAVSKLAVVSELEVVANQEFAARIRASRDDEIAFCLA